ncbi:MAG: hypothetical protein ABI718_17285, partial [Acidobacteriota bacterium]
KHTGSKTVDKGEQLIFSRLFEGRRGNKNYFEASQKLIQAFGLHFVSERTAYCRLDKLGDLEDGIRISRLGEPGNDWSTTVVTVRADILAEWTALTDSVVVRMFDFTRFRPSNFGGWSGSHEPAVTVDDDLIYRRVVQGTQGSYTRGIQLVKPPTSKEEAYELYQAGPRETRYVSFLAHDWKNETLREISTDPSATSNYFTKSALPFETSPAFFKPDVLLRYKSDSEKYRLEARSISCRGAWHLQTYDINEAGQVHTYMCYLRDLPYEEHLYWKAHNEPPKAGISRRAFASDFDADWDFSEIDPLHDLKARFERWGKERRGWCLQRSQQTIDAVHYPVTASPDEWASELLALDQLVVEGMDQNWLRQQLKSLGRRFEPAWAAIKLTKEVLLALGYEEDRAEVIVRPLVTSHFLRTKLKGHSMNQAEINKFREETLSKHKNYNAHFRALCSDADECLEELEQVFAVERT